MYILFSHFKFDELNDELKQLIFNKCTSNGSYLFKFYEIIDEEYKNKMLCDVKITQLLILDSVNYKNIDQNFILESYSKYKEFFLSLSKYNKLYIISHITDSSIQKKIATELNVFEYAEPFFDEEILDELIPFFEFYKLERSLSKIKTKNPYLIASDMIYSENNFSNYIKSSCIKKLPQLA